MSFHRLRLAGRNKAPRNMRGLSLLQLMGLIIVISIVAWVVLKQIQA